MKGLIETVYTPENATGDWAKLFAERPDLKEVIVDHVLEEGSKELELFDVTVYYVDVPQEPFPITSLRPTGELRMKLEDLTGW